MKMVVNVVRMVMQHECEPPVGRATDSAALARGIGTAAPDLVQQRVSIVRAHQRRGENDGVERDIVLE